MRYVPNTETQKEEMLKEIGVSAFEDLIESVPAAVRLKGKLRLPEAMSEAEVEEMIYGIAKTNADSRSVKPLVGAGAYRHHVPEAERFLLQREEFWTAYTPYQPELSQGTLQSMFELQTHLARLTKMEVVVPSMYDGASATAEAVLMSLRLTRRNRIVVSSSVHPYYRETVKAYVAPHSLEIVELGHRDGLLDIGELKEAVDDGVASVTVQSPNFFGGIENLAEVSQVVHDHGGLMVTAVAESLSLGVLKGPGEVGADIVAGEAQSFGMDLNYGGPYNGYLATRKQFVRQLPGRIVGETKDVDGKRVFVMTMRAREQDIRREKATSNICSNHGLNITAANIYLSLMGTKGLHKLSLLNTKAAHYLEGVLLNSGRFERVFDYPFYNEFLLRSKGRASAVCERLLENGFIPPLEMSRFYEGEDFEDVLLFAVTEVLSREDLDRVARIVSE
ncbi:MAG: aminomethyl-transferring glycine dehydrogenase subunit GcvPA [Dehalococcoidia bacterium]|nr:aminomethyl-transferring glycine dehydrogenase subunit GcvPA [Dehalococcoidia bacterium]